MVKIETQITKRIETGPLQINNDWPGVFLRGDESLYYAECLENALQNDDPISKVVLQNLLNVLKECKS